MKQYQIVFNVPDDFVPEELELTASYGKGQGEISIEGESFIKSSEEDVTKAWEELKSIVEEKISFKIDEVPENSVIRILFPPEVATDFESLSSLNTLKDAVEAVYRKPCICYCNSMDLMVDNADDAIKMLNGMIAKIKTRAAVKNTSGIVIAN